MRNNITMILALVALMTVNTVNASDNMFNIKTAPVSALIGISNLELDIAVSEHFTLGPSYTGFNFEHSDVDYDADAFGVRANYYFDRALAGGWLFGLSASYGDFVITKENNLGITFTATAATRAYTVLFSYQAMWNHFNMTFGLGASYFSLPSTMTAVEGVDILEIDTSILSGVTPNAEFTVGWRF